MSNCCRSPSKTQIIKIDFGRVSTGTIARRTFKILNEDCKKQYYQIRRDPKTNPLDNAFTFEFDNWILLPGSSVDCKIEYRPMLPFHYNIDYFDITNCDSTCYKILVQGNCVGPNVVSSVSRLLMICPKQGREVNKRLQLTNSSGVAAIFMFDIDQTHCPFKVDVTKGTINPNSHINITITFSPSRKGFHARYLTCLIHNQNPIVTELYGYQGSLVTRAEEFVPLYFADPKPLIRDFEGYMSDAVDVLKGSYPPISVTNHCLDFGRGAFDEKNTLQPITQNICLTNHSSTDLIVRWDEDPEHIFNIKPNSLTIRGQKSGLFEIYFVPNKPDALFSREILAQAFWKTEGNEPSSRSTSTLPVPIPLIASIRMIGQSFSSQSVGWIPQYEVPPTVVLPPCLPLLPVYTTFLIKFYGHLPMTFRFVPPLITQFAVKPMVGIIQSGYQIVAVQLFPNFDGEHRYIEQWTIQFNGNSETEVAILFKAYAEYPKLSLNDSNIVVFSPVYPRCEQTSQVTMRNTTRHCIRYTFPDLPSEISLEQTTGIIQANQILTHDWIFSPKETGDYKYEVLCRVTTLRAGCPVGTDIDIPVEVTGTAEHGYLVALPEELNFGTVNYGETGNLSFHVFNFSSVNIHYKLRCKRKSWRIGNRTCDIQMKPETETIHPGNNEKIDICIIPRESGFHQLTIQYSLRSESPSKTVLEAVEPRDICMINCMCIMPGFEVKDLLYLAHREHISKAMLWNLLEIDNFNITTTSVSPGNEKAVDLHFPELVVSHDPLLIRLLIVNSAPAQSDWTLTRVKKCDCKQVVKTRGLTFKYKEYSCDHRLVCTISPNEGVLLPGDQTVLTIKVCYTLLGKTSLQWRLKLSNDRNVIINADVIALSDIENRPSLLAKQVLSFEKIYIGDMDAMNQMFWMYNSMDHKVTYSVDISSLHQINIQTSSETFLCKNPRGAVPKRSYYPIIFKFQPRRFESFKVDLPLKLGDTWTNLAIKAETDISNKTRFMLGKIPRSDQFSIPELPVYFSVDNIVVPLMPMYSKVNRMVMIFNESKNDVIGYQWRSYDMPKILGIEVIPKNGRIQPTKGQSFCITIRSLSQPCKITASLSCRFLNLTAQRHYEKSIIMYNSLCEELAGQFIITEAGITEPKPWLKPADKPKLFYKALSISCYIYSSLDTDLKATVDEQLKSSPTAEIRIGKNERCSVADKKLLNISTFILEGMIWDILHSNIFMNSLKESLVKLPNVKYGQYVIPSMTRRKLNDRSYNIPPKQFLEFIFEQMILGIVHEEFGLSLYHFNGPEDIRQFCYQKRDERSTQQNKIYKSNSKGSKQHLDSEDEAKVESKEFYLESQVKFNVEDEESSDESNN